MGESGGHKLPSGTNSKAHNNTRFPPAPSWAYIKKKNLKHVFPSRKPLWEGKQIIPTPGGTQYGAKP